MTATSPGAETGTETGTETVPQATIASAQVAVDSPATTQTAAVTDAHASEAPAVAPSSAEGLPVWDGPQGWQPLPKRAYRVFLYAALLVASVPSLFSSLILSGALAELGAGRWAVIGGVWAIAIGLALWVARKRYRYTFWLLDEDGFAVRRGRLWQWETRVPTSRVQHLDLKRGPLERSHGLASLVLHTAGTRLSAVSISGLNDADAERLRDHFARWIDRQQDDDDHA